MIKWNLFSQIILFYAIITIFIYYVSDLAIFPIPKPSYTDAEIHAIKLSTEDGKKISAVFLPNQRARFTILFSHGNAEDLGDLMPFFETYRDQGFSIFAYDYHGYGRSEGRPSEANTYLDIKAAFNYLTQVLHIPENQIILHGRSLGTGPTLEIATKERVAGIILESPMLTAFQIVTAIPLFPLDKYRNSQKIKNVHVPVLFIHGTKDEVIPFWHGKRLYEMANAPKIFFSVPGAGHNNILLTSGKAYWNAILKFSASLNEANH